MTHPKTPQPESSNARSGAHRSLPGQLWQALARRPDIIFLLLLVVLARLVPHPWNVTPIGAIALFAGARLDPRWSWLVALVPLAIGDLLIGGYNAIAMMFVYLGIAGSALIGYLWLGKKATVVRGAGGVVSGSLWFFLASNFGVWAAGYYPPTVAGLVECYVKGLPFLTNTMVGDGLYAMAIFGLFTLVVGRRSKPVISA
ncbi:MAG: DUF6580 family putative transport protein [Lysobacterales bacterium]